MPGVQTWGTQTSTFLAMPRTTPIQLCLAQSWDLHAAQQKVQATRHIQAYWAAACTDNSLVNTPTIEPLPCSSL